MKKIGNYENWKFKRIIKYFNDFGFELIDCLYYDNFGDIELNFKMNKIDIFEFYNEVKIGYLNLIDYKIDLFLNIDKFYEYIEKYDLD